MFGVVTRRFTRLHPDGVGEIGNRVGWSLPLPVVNHVWEGAAPSKPADWDA